MDVKVRNNPTVKEAMAYFANVYMNTGCEPEEALEHAEFVVRQAPVNDPDSIAQYLYSEGVRYEDM